ncbi:aspartate aminotransferase family protein [Brucella melitensis]|uniref:Acetylornithine aminotransferase n=1 Tax=Brucella melitensis biotype 1 (strain ATCC 23456 / CCUG 17765 / NCTC 10094 / 16M) TaxID=224914 RepID=Q8YCT7_BRUME|nr:MULTISPECIES: aspartate aminotransferase family protein [Brucella]EPZ76828.1 aminotransferase class III [Brucella melitensis ADMAS-G1]AAL53683.1 acetylornithine aminotransferase [Brucella melitensis bv. 1 str. 16M]AIJ88373.1 aminotransferase class-III family protein [Brucella melitensis bv. 1 str. 16M]ARY45418.1 aspartate aminotransferase family protein [Brucella melitensis]ARY48579.1 aspartate aminotransferase family protein [Brucella melitensis]
MKSTIHSEGAAVSASVANHTPKPPLLSVDDAKALDLPRMTELFTAHLNPGQLHFMKLLGFHKVKVERAEGMYYYDQNGRRILDFFGGFGSLAFGHNHPRIIAARRKFQEELRHEIAIAFMSQYAAALAYDLAACSPGDLDMVFLGSSGSEAMEAAIKVAERAAGPKKPKIVYAENSFHGKTKGVLSITDGGLYRGEFKLVDNTVRVPFGDITAIENAFRSDPEIGTIVLETVQGGCGIIQADAEFWQKLRQLCDRYGVIWVADEVQCGFGRTGKFYAFEHYGVIPDVTALAKSLGGGKAAMAAMIARRDIYMKAYGTPKTAMIHAMATFGGIGEACITAIEAVNILYDEQLIDNSAEVGDYLLERLKELQVRYPGLLKDVRGKGMMVGLEFHDFSQAMPMVLRPMLAMLDDKLKGSLPGFIGSHLLRDHGVLVAFTEYNRNVIRLEPPLICQRAHVDEFIKALDEVLSRGIVKIVKDFIKAQIK